MINKLWPSKRVAGLLIALLFPIALLANNAEVRFSHSGGFYENPFGLSLSCQEGYTIHYTTNGNEPKWTDAQYHAPLWLDEKLFSDSKLYTIQTCDDEIWYMPDDIRKCIVIRAATFDQEGYQIGKTITNSYFIAALDDKRMDIPIVSLCSDSISLFGYEKGIYVKGATHCNYCQTGRDWERLCNVEFYEPKDNSGINQQAGLRIHGHVGRMGMQKGLRLYARKEYGKKRFHHKFFEATELTSFKHLVLKPVGNGLIRDHISAEIAQPLNFEKLGSRLVILFINGEYWGLYYLKERADDHFIADHFGYDEKDVNIIESWNGDVTSGNNENFVQTMRWVAQADLSDDGQYAELCKMIDIDCFIDYYCFQLFAANSDWPDNNMRCWQANDGKWRWMFYDGDYCLADYRPMLQATLYGKENKDVSTFLFSKLLTNTQFRDCFYKRYGNLLTHEFYPKKTHKYFYACMDDINKDIQEHFSRFGLLNYDAAFDFQVRFVDEFLSIRMVSAAAMIYQLYYYNGWDYNLSESQKQIKFKYNPESHNPTFLFRMAKQFKDWRYVSMYFAYERHRIVQGFKDSNFHQNLKKWKPWKKLKKSLGRG